MKEKKILTTTKLKLIKAGKFLSISDYEYGNGTETTEAKPKKSINDFKRREIKLISIKLQKNEESITLPDIAKTLPNETIQPSHSITEIDESYYENRKIDENNVKKLNIWEKDILNKDLYEDDQYLETKKDLEGINWKNDVRDNLKKLSLNSNNFFSNFFKAGDQEQGSILIQNLNVGKKKFNFQLFKDDINAHYNHNNERIDTEEDLYTKYNKLKNDDNYDNIVKADYYRNIIKEKIRLELNYSQELNKIAQKIFEAKKKKEKYTNDIFDFMNYVKELEIEFNVKYIKIEQKRCFEE
jgi:hypothetical protein